MGIAAWKAALDRVGRACVLTADLPETLPWRSQESPSLDSAWSLTEGCWINKNLPNNLEPVTFRPQKNMVPGVESVEVLWK